jgi:hypothetical protein
VIQDSELAYLRRCVELAREALEAGDEWTPRPGPSGRSDIVADEPEHAGVDQVVQQVIADVVVQAEALLLDEEVRRSKRHLQAGLRRLPRRDRPTGRRDPGPAVCVVS